MAQVAVADPAPSNSFSFPFAGDNSMVHGNASKKRKTPSELRGEQLKKKNPAKKLPPLHPLQEIDKNGVTALGVKKAEPSKPQKYIDTRVDDVFPVKKSSDMFKLLYGKEKSKITATPLADSSLQNENDSQHAGIQLGDKSKQPPLSDDLGTSNTNKPEECFNRFEKCSQTTFRTVAEISLDKERPSGDSVVDMDKALKGLVVRERPSASYLNDDMPRISRGVSLISSAHASTEILIAGKRSPLDLSLKSEVRFITSSSVSWCHRMGTCSAFTMIPQFASKFVPVRSEHANDLLPVNSTGDLLFAQALVSWVYPESSLPASVISAINLCASRGESDFMLRRQLAWEDSFRSLYYMLRKKMNDIFYLCTSQFVVLFIGVNADINKRSCNAYLSRSTLGLRSLLREHDITFSMPLCHQKIEEAAAEDLAELSELEKHNLGQLRRHDSLSGVDNSCQSLLAFTGNDNVHALFDFLINYRSFLNFLANTDVPLLYSPVPFRNSSLHTAEVKCKEMRKAEAVFSSVSSIYTKHGSQNVPYAPGICYSIDVKDTVIPPWTISGLCAALVSQNSIFETSFVMESTSEGLNAGLDAIISQKSDDCQTVDGLTDSSTNFGISESVVFPCLKTASLRSLKYDNGSFKASLISL